MTLFVNEAAMQAWLKERLEKVGGLAELICNKEDLETFVPNGLLEQRIHETFSFCLKSLYLTKIVTANENVALGEDEILRPDFILYSIERESIVIVELKNIAGPSRQAGTELSAYNAEVKTYLPFIADDDVVSVVISTAWPTLLRRYLVNELFWLGRKVICLEPVKDGQGICLRIKGPREIAADEIVFQLGQHHVGGYQLCLYNLPKESDAYIRQMKAAMAAFSSKGNATGNHGFAFLWKDNWKETQAAYSITILNVAAFPALDRFVFGLGTDEKLSEIQERFIRIVSEYAPEGHGGSLEEIREYGSSFLLEFCKPYPEGFTTWASLKKIMISRGQLVSFSAWGMFGELFFDKLRAKFKEGSPEELDSPELGLALVDEIVRDDIPYVDLTYYFGEAD